MRPKRNYLSGRQGEPGDLKPPSSPPPVRAWLEPKDNGLLHDYGLFDGLEPWVLTVEDGQRNPFFRGEFDHLIRIAGDHGATEFRVWSPSRRTFVKVDTEPVAPVE